VRDVVARGLARVDEDGNLHRLVGRRDAEHLARDVVLTDDEISRPEIGHRRPGIVDDADEHRALNRLRDHAWRGRHGREEKQERAEGDPPVVHDLWDRLSRLSTIHNKPSSAVFEPRRRSGPAAIRKHNH